MISPVKGKRQRADRRWDSGRARRRVSIQMISPVKGKPLIQICMSWKKESQQVSIQMISPVKGKFSPSITVSPALTMSFPFK
jgi:hypothetical protein